VLIVDPNNLSLPPVKFSYNHLKGWFAPKKFRIRNITEKLRARATGSISFGG